MRPELCSLTSQGSATLVWTLGCPPSLTSPLPARCWAPHKDCPGPCDLPPACPLLGHLLLPPPLEACPCFPQREATSYLGGACISTASSVGEVLSSGLQKSLGHLRDHGEGCAVLSPCLTPERAVSRPRASGLQAASSGQAVSPCLLQFCCLTPLCPLTGWGWTRRATCRLAAQTPAPAPGGLVAGAGGLSARSGWSRESSLAGHSDVR